MANIKKSAGDIMSVAVNTAEVNAKLNTALQQTFEEWGLLAERYAKYDCPVDTGRLRSSIMHQVDMQQKAAVIGTNVEYAASVEFNDKTRHKVGKAHFMRDAIKNHNDEYKRIAEKNLKGL